MKEVLNKAKLMMKVNTKDFLFCFWCLYNGCFSYLKLKLNVAKALVGEVEEFKLYRRRKSEKMLPYYVGIILAHKENGTVLLERERPNEKTNLCVGSRDGVIWFEMT